MGLLWFGLLQFLANLRAPLRAPALKPDMPYRALKPDMPYRALKPDMPYRALKPDMPCVPFFAPLRAGALWRRFVTRQKLK